MRDDLEARGYALAESTRAMGMVLPTSRRTARTGARRRRLAEYLDSSACPKGCSSGVDQGEFRILVAG